MDIALEYDLLVIEDACESLGATFNGQRAGTFGDAGVFAFYPNKQMTTGEGGMITTNDSRIAELCRSMRNQGRDTDGAWLRHVRLGYNYRLSELHAALGLGQLERIEEILAARDRVARRYSQGFAGQAQLQVLENDSRFDPQLVCVHRPISLGPPLRSFAGSCAEHPARQGHCLADLLHPHSPAALLSRSASLKTFPRCLIPIRPRMNAWRFPFTRALSDAEIQYVCDAIKRSPGTARTQVPRSNPLPPRSSRQALET